MSDDAAKTTAAVPASTAPTRGRQLRVMLDKLWLVRKRSVGQNIQLYVIPIMSLIVMYLFYGAFQAGNNKWKSSGILELVFLPIALLFLLIFWLISIVGCVGCCCMLKKDKYEDDEVTCADSKGACMCWFCEP